MKAEPQRQSPGPRLARVQDGGSVSSPSPPDSQALLISVGRGA